MSDLSRAAVEAVDASKQVDDVLGLPDHLRDALWRVESARLTPHDSRGGFIVAGMGGSAIGGALARAVLGDRASRPIAIARDYGLPAWTTDESTVLCASYSGNTEETLAAYEAAGVIGAQRIVATTGGKLAAAAREDGVPVIPLPGMFQPRVAVGYMLVIALEVAALSGAAESLRSEIDVAAAHIESLVQEWGPDGAEDSLAKEIARGLHGTIPQIAGAGLTAPIAYRWKTQLNENGKTPAFATELPELNHNELVGWQGAAELGRFSAVFLDDSDLHPRIRQRIELTRGLISPTAAASYRVEGRGETRTERLVSLVLLGDLVSLYVAVLRGIDPTPVDAIERLKTVLAGG
ncbi:bifunctional phosphoglucose/phosphomannose isomerase [Conexibacter sp. JD483]|uniref:bifunctional phosphoglucose/phosphomannose isomerase n=1 Tax=unclassified Conexibacter TaxID=2627773 RepID=UPI002716E5B0|nr:MULTISPECIES: bifunctional phosphoglucose/phosphomannose isomerase [unclassified Conexibacter]MDO8186772.1 bifunctional phosphoglucose/phosphomannose isomerase [Conexibacter sp. CPCC 205706]MDO8199058.1 bifunctional phosphoglucose/phosphomannose isomerase [Conexibacter sp. CPCC 205762]MDR9368510.1 bifunctional phosphoglucose/phosphomannose isomerase [Conexibacter sp. JD483]